jgi:UDP-glucose 4-epimerase
MQQITGRGSVVVFGDGQQTRDYVFIDDVVDALVAAADAPGADGQIINVGSGAETALNDLIALIGATVEVTPKVLYNREQSGGIRRLVADLEKADRLLGYHPRTELAAGLRQLLQRDPIFFQNGAVARTAAIQTLTP